MVLDMDDCFESMDMWKEEKIDLALSQLKILYQFGGICYNLLGKDEVKFLA